LNNPNLLLDDAFISFRYAHNLAGGLGLVFNPGERVEGYTNFLWTVLLAGSIKLGLDVGPSSVVLGGLSAVGTLYLVLTLADRALEGAPHKWWAVAGAVLAFTAMGSQARFVVSGMETMLFVFLVTLSAYAYLFSGKPFITGLLFALAALCRPEGVLYFGFAALLTLASAERRKKDLVRLIGGFLALYLPYFIWRYAYYGYLFPNTYYAKASGFSLQRLGRGLSELKWILDEWFYWPVLGLSLFSIPSLRSSRIVRFGWGITLITFAYFIYVGGDFVIWFGPRFLMPALAFNLLLAIQGLWAITGWIRSAEWIIFAGRILGLAALLGLILGLSGPVLADTMSAFANQMQSWKELALWMKANLPAKTTLAADAAGIIPFYTNFYTLDMFGLTDAHIAHLDIPTGVGTIGHEKFDPAYILSKHPDCILSTGIDAAGEPVMAGLLDFKEQIKQQYALVAVSRSKAPWQPEGPWVIRTQAYSADLGKAGYGTGLYCNSSIQP